MSHSVVLLAGRGKSTAIVYHALRREFPALAVIQERRPPRLVLLRRRAQRLGWAKVAGQVMFRGIMMPSLDMLSRRRIAAILESAGLTRAPLPPRAVLRVPSVNSPDCLAALRRLSPSVVVVNGTRFLKDEVLRCVPACFLNMHAGITPLYRGVHGAYWALAQNDRPHCGVTVHQVDTGIDTGGIVAQATIVPTAADNFATYPYLQLASGIPLLLDAVRAALDGRLRTLPAPSGESHLWYHPTLGEYLHHRLAQGVK